MQRSRFIQSTRFAAAILVVVTHITLYIRDRLDPAAVLWRFGEIGVPIFFLISGYVMAAVAEKKLTGGRSALDFFVKRFIRVVPLYWLATFIKIVVAIIFPIAVLHNHFDWGAALKSLFFVPYFNSAGEMRPMHGVGWTLLHEFFFYLLFSICIYFSRKASVVVASAIAILFLIGQVFELNISYWKLITSHYNMYFVIGIGARIAAMSGSNIARLFVALGICFIPQSLPGGSLLVSVFAFALWKHELIDRIDFPAWLESLGDSSYALYLFHPFIAPALLVVSKRMNPDANIYVVGCIVVFFTVAIAHALHLIIEKPTLASMNRIWGKASVRFFNRESVLIK